MINETLRDIGETIQFLRLLRPPFRSMIANRHFTQYPIVGEAEGTEFASRYVRDFPFLCGVLSFV